MKANWLAPAQAQFSQLYTKLPHALLIHGTPGIGKFEFASGIIKSLVCDKPLHNTDAVQACENCHNCQLLKAGNHPDFHFISSEQFSDSDKNTYPTYTQRYLEDLNKRKKRKPRKIISVDQIRLLIENFTLSNHSARHKIALIQPADAMNINASNALLKLLEEPNPETILILLSNDITQLPMTIRSRCIGLAMTPPKFNLGLQWLHEQGLDEHQAYYALSLASGSPYLALEYANSNQLEQFDVLIKTLEDVLKQDINPIEAGKALLTLEPIQTLIIWLQNIINWLIKTLTPAHEAAENLAYKTQLADLLAALKPQQRPILFKLYDDLTLSKQKDLSVINSHLLLEKWLISFSQNLKLRSIQ